MTPEERQMLSGLFDRIRGAANGPKDRDAEAFINEAMRNTPAAAYVLAQTVLVQQQALEAASRHIEELEAQAQQAPPQQESSFLGNIGRSIFGGGPSQAPQQRPYDARGYERDAGPPPGYPPQRPGYAPPPPPPPQQGGPWGGPPPAQGGGFLQGALQTATGVAGGVLLGNALGGLFGGHGGGGLTSSAFAAPRETVNNYYGTDVAGLRAQDTLQDMDQDQDEQQDADDYASDDSSGGDDDYA